MATNERSTLMVTVISPFIRCMMGGLFISGALRLHSNIKSFDQIGKFFIPGQLLFLIVSVFDILNHKRMESGSLEYRRARNFQLTIDSFLVVGILFWFIGTSLFFSPVNLDIANIMWFVGFALMIVADAAMFEALRLAEAHRISFASCGSRFVGSALFCTGAMLMLFPLDCHIEGASCYIAASALYFLHSIFSAANDEIIIATPNDNEADERSNKMNLTSSILRCLMSICFLYGTSVLQSEVKAFSDDETGDFNLLFSGAFILAGFVAAFFVRILDMIQDIKATGETSLYEDTTHHWLYLVGEAFWIAGAVLTFVHYKEHLVLERSMWIFGLSFFIGANLVTVQHLSINKASFFSYASTVLYFVADVMLFIGSILLSATGNRLTGTSFFTAGSSLFVFHSLCSIGSALFTFCKALSFDPHSDKDKSEDIESGQSMDKSDDKESGQSMDKSDDIESSRNSKKNVIDEENQIPPCNQRLRDIVKEENELVNNRMVWFLQFQGFLFLSASGFATKSDPIFRLIISIPGLLSGRSIINAISAAENAMKNMEKDNTLKHYRLRGLKHNEWKTGCFGDPCKALIGLIMFAWSCVIAYCLVFIYLQVQEQGDWKYLFLEKTQ